MNWPEIQEVLGGMTPEQSRAWFRGGACVLLAIALALLVESWFFRGRRAAWLLVRVGSFPVAVFTFAAVVLPARATSGMEGLAVFYGLLFTVAPLLWFGYHRVAAALMGPWIRPGETVPLALWGLATPAILGMAAAYASEAATAAVLEQGARPVPAAGRGDPLPHQVQPARHFTVGGAQTVYAQSLIAPAGLTIEKVEVRGGAPLWNRVEGSSEAWCLDRGSIHFFWSPFERTPVLRLHWRLADGRTGRTEFGPVLGSTVPAAEAFTIAFDGAAVRPSAPIPRARVDLELALAQGGIHAVGAGSAEAGEPDCVGAADGRPAWRGTGMPVALSIMIRPPAPAPNRVTLRRPDS